MDIAISGTVSYVGCKLFYLCLSIEIVGVGAAPQQDIQGKVRTVWIAAAPQLLRVVQYRVDHALKAMTV